MILPYPRLTHRNTCRYFMSQAQ